MKKSKVNKKGILSCSDIVFNDVTKIHPALKSSLGYCLFKVSALFRTQLERHYKQLQVSPHHAAILTILISEEATSQNQNRLCEELGIDKASMVKLIDHLEKKQLDEIVNSSADRRVKYLRITAKGKNLHEKAQLLKNNLEMDFLKNLKKEQVDSFKTILGLLLT